MLVRLVCAKGKQYNTRDELKHAILASLAKIGEREIKALYDSLPKRIFEVIKAREGSTKYQDLYISIENVLKHPVDNFTLRLVSDFEDFGT